MSIAVSESLDYSPKEISSGSYVFRAVNPENGQPVLALNSTTNTDFLLPNTVFNLSRSYLNFNFLLNDTAATAVDRWNVAHNGFLAPIDGIILSTASGVRLCEMNNLPEYTKIAWRPQTDYQEFLTNPCHSNSQATIAAVTEAGQLFNRIRAINDLTTSDASFAASSGHISTEAGTAQTAAEDSYNAVANYIGMTVTTAQNGNGALGVRVQLPLKMIYGSILAVDKDLYFGEQLRLTIRWNQGAKFGYLTATSLRSIAAASVDLTESPTMSSVVLRMAVETNEAVANSLKQRVLAGEGLNINIPFTYAYKSLSSAVALDSNTVIRKLNRGHGSKLLRVLAGIYANAQTGARYCNVFNGTAAAQIKWSNYRSFLDSKPLSDDVLLVSDFTAWQAQSPKVKGSVIKGVKDWLQCPVIIEDFSGVPYSKDYPKSDHMASGIDLAIEREYAFQYTNVPATAMPCYLFCVCLKQLSISSQGISVM